MLGYQERFVPHEYSRGCISFFFQGARSFNIRVYFHAVNYISSINAWNTSSVHQYDNRFTQTMVCTQLTEKQELNNFCGT